MMVMVVMVVMMPPRVMVVVMMTNPDHNLGYFRRRRLSQPRVIGL
jgi:hypothetical protein